jgi:hypothetical protein
MKRLYAPVVGSQSVRSNGVHTTLEPAIAVSFENMNL